MFKVETGVRKVLILLQKLKFLTRYLINFPRHRTVCVFWSFRKHHWIYSFAPLVFHTVLPNSRYDTIYQISILSIPSYFVNQESSVYGDL